MAINYTDRVFYGIISLKDRGYDTMKNDLRKKVLEMGADLCGFAGVDRFKDAPEGFHPNDLYKDCRSVIVFGKSIPKGLVLLIAINAE